MDEAFGFQGPGRLLPGFGIHNEGADENADLYRPELPAGLLARRPGAGRAEFETFRTPENLNLDIVELPAGKHRAVFKVVRQGAGTTLSINYKCSFRPGERMDAHVVGLEFLA